MATSTMIMHNVRNQKASQCDFTNMTMSSVASPGMSPVEHLQEVVEQDMN